MPRVSDAADRPRDAAGVTAAPPLPREGGSGSDLQRLARGGFLGMLGSVSNALFQFLLVIVITRGLSPREAGVFFQAMALFLVLAQSAELGADTGFVRMIARYRSLGRTQDLRRTLAIGLWPSIGVSALIGLAIFLLAAPLSGILLRGKPEYEDGLVPYLRVFAVFLPLATATTVLMAATRGFSTMVPSVAIENVGRQALRPLLAYVVIAAGLGSTALALAWGIPTALASVAAAVWLLYLLRRAERLDRVEPGPPRPLGALAGEFWRFSAPRGLATLFNVTLFRLDTLLVGALVSSRQAGIYAAATRYIVFGYIALTAVQQVIAPLISGLLAREETHERAEEVYRTATQWLILLSWPLYLGMAVFSPLLMRIFGETYQAGQYALTAVALASLVNMATGPCSVVLVMGGRSTWALVNSIGALAINLGLNLLLIPRFGMTGAGIAWAVAIVFNNVAALAMVRAFLRLSPFGPGFTMAVALSTGCFGVLGIAARILFGATLGSAVLVAAVGGGIYAALLWRLRDQLNLADLRRGVSIRRQRLAPRAAPAPAGSLDGDGGRTRPDPDLASRLETRPE